MSETLTFGPQWLRALSSGNSVTSPPPSPGPKYKLAEYRYGKEEMLALFIEDLEKPIELDSFSSIAKVKCHFPLAFIPPTEEEQRYSVGSVNSNAVLKLMGRGSARGAARGVRGGVGGRGRGRGDGGFMRQTSFEDSRNDTGFARDPRRQSWEDGRRGGFDKTSLGRGYDPTALRGRLTSDNSWEKNEKSSDNWRRSRNEEDDGEGWHISGQRSAEKMERWRGSKGTRGSWRNSDSFHDERGGGYPDEEWQVARGNRRSFHERDGNRWNTSSEPEWCKDDNIEDLDVTGTFDSSGAFRSQKSPKGNNEQSQAKKDDVTDEKPPQEKTPEEKSPITDKTKLPSPTQPPPKPQTTTQETAVVSSSSSVSPRPSSPPKPIEAQVTPTKLPTKAGNNDKKKPPVESPEEKAREEEPNMEHFAKEAESLVMSLDDEVEKSDPDSSCKPPGFPTPPVSTPSNQAEEIKWFYTDPQGKMQGPFTNSEMADWFKHGYFTMNLLIKRATDEAFQPLGDLIKSWGRVPFLPGPQPPPYKGIPEQLQQQQHLLAQQQQYRQLLQQHLLQQQFLQQQAIMMQQQQQLQMHHQQEQQPPATGTNMATTLSQSPQPIIIDTSPRMEIPPQHLQPTTLEQRKHQQHLQQQHLQKHLAQQQQQQQQQQQRPQALTVSSESIWGTSATKPTSPGIMSPGPWSPVSTASAVAPGRGWDVEAGNKEKVQSLQEIQRIEEEKERAIKLENERREAILRQEQEEVMRRRQQEYLLQKRREEEERRRLEEMEKKKREQEELIKKQQDELRRKQEEEILKQQQQHQQQHQHIERQRQLEQQKRLQEEQRLHKMRQQQQQALARLQQQQQELQRQKDLELQQQQELQQKLQQKRQQNQGVTNSLWGSSPTSSAPSLSQIQQQQEKRERAARIEHERQLQQERELQQRNSAAAGWTERNSKGPGNVKSLLEIQQEQERQLQLARKQNQQLSRSHPQPQSPAIGSSVWGNNTSLSSSWAANTPSNPPPTAVWGANKPVKQQQRFNALSIDDDDDSDEDDEDDDEEDFFWDDAVKAATKAGQTKQQQQSKPPQQQQQPKPQSQHGQQKNKQTNNAAFPGLVNAKAPSKRTNKDEENVRRLFQQQASASDEFARWCEQALRSMNVTGVDIPTFFAFLKEVESPYEVHDYVKSYVGDNKEAQEFARDFIEQRKKSQSQNPQSTQKLPQKSVWGNTNQKTQPSKPASLSHPHSMQTQSVQIQDDGLANAQGDSTSNKKKKKKKMQKVDPRILGFSVNAAERVNIGEIQTLEDS